MWGRSDGKVIARALACVVYWQPMGLQLRSEVVELAAAQPSQRGDDTFIGVHDIARR
jgi:hypothetical protein